MDKHIKSYVTQHINDITSWKSGRDNAYYCVNCTCSSHYIKDRFGCTETSNVEKCEKFINFDTILEDIRYDTEEYFDKIESSKSKRTLIDPLDDNAVIKAIKDFAVRRDVAIMIVPNNKLSGYDEFDVDINKIVNEDFWGLV